jgi:uncharacterized protein YjbK
VAREVTRKSQSMIMNDQRPFELIGSGFHCEIEGNESRLGRRLLFDSLSNFRVAERPPLNKVQRSGLAFPDAGPRAL